MNPLRELLERHNMTGKDLSLLSGLSLSRIYAVLNGVCVFPHQLLPVIEKTGENAGNFLSSYETYREQRQEVCVAGIDQDRFEMRNQNKQAAITEPKTEYR